MEKKKILLVEDNADDILLVQRAFSKTKLSDKYDLIITQDGFETIRYLDSNGNSHNGSALHTPLAFILLDLKLPRMNGFEILERIRSNEKTKLIPVVIFTSSKEDQDITKSYLFGANGYVRKPIDSGKFALVLQNIVTFWGDVNEIPINQ
jgi:two-component system, response regulator